MSLFAHKSILVFLLLLNTFYTSNSTSITNNFKNVENTNLNYNNSTDTIPWIHNLQLLHKGIKDCVKLSKDTTWNCFKINILRIFDGIMSSRVIRLWDGIRFVRVADDDVANKNLDIRKNVLKERYMYNREDISQSFERKDLQHLTWFDRLAMSLAKTLTTHTLQINLQELTDAYIRAVDKEEISIKNNITDPIGTGRHRRHRYNMIITMMFGVTALGAVLVPMGFQILSVVSGKALLLAKMALLLASINGLKRVANSGVHYGLYQVPGEHFGGGYYDRGDAHHPRNVPALALSTQPLDLLIRK